MTTPYEEQDILEKLMTRAQIRRQIMTRRSVQEGKPDRIAQLCEDAANEILILREEKAKLLETISRLMPPLDW